jgi:hypothetical protein
VTLDEWVTPTCPVCSQPPAYVLDGGHQAWCGNEFGCNVLTWDMFLTVDQLKQNETAVELPFRDEFE